MSKIKKGLDFQHYYLRNPETNQPYGVVVIGAGKDPGTVNRGISLCATMDKWDRADGVRKALRRMRAAQLGQRNSECIRDYRYDSDVVTTFYMDYGPVFAQYPDTDDDTICKSAHNVPAIDFEKPILENIIKRTTAAAIPTLTIFPTAVELDT